MDPLLLPIRDAAKVLGIGRSRLYELIAADRLSIRKIGHKTLVPREDLLTFAASLERKTVTPPKIKPVLLAPNADVSATRIA